VAGATLLAFGNGAPDLFTNLAAITSKGKVDVPMAIGFVIGANNFVIMVVLACGTRLFV
jgi:sodium/potassium/calcium exchanger 6